MVASLLACLTLIPIHAAAEIHWVNPVGREVPAPLPAEAAPAVEQVRARLSDLAPRKSTDKEATGRHVFVQLAGPITDTQRKDLAAGGMRLLAYLGDHAFFASLTPGADTDRIARSQAVVDAVAVQRAWKLHPALATGNVPDWARVGGPAAGNQPADRASPAAPADATDVAAYVLFHPDVPLDPDARSACRRHGARVRAAVASVNGLVVELPLANVPALADEDGVQWIEPPLPRLSEVNNGIRHITQTDAVQSAPYNLDGSGVSVLVYDGGTAWPGHPDFGNRVTALDASGISYHATHVAGTIGGSGAASDGKYRGMAPAATIASYGFEYDGSGYFLYTNPGDIEADYRAAIETHGARVANNSIGMNVARNGFPCEFEGDYGVTSMLIDAIVAGSLGEPTRVVWANGNERGGVRCGTAYHTLAPPAGAKNPIGVGAVNSNDDSVTWFTSWGPTDDGRLKPDVSAPGCQLSDDFGVTSTSTTGKYMTLCGTSMAAPAVTGMCALLIQQWEAMHPGGEPPRNAALKAVLAHSAVDLGPVGPDYQSGYGSVRVRDAVDLVRAGQVFDGEVSQGGAQTFVIRVVAGTPVLKATLAWDDPPAAPNVVTALVNDLDVVAISPKGGRFHLPWTLDPGRPELPAVQTQPDRVNNLEQVVVNDPSPGTWVIQVRGYSVPAGPQVFSLAVSSSASSCSSAGTIAFGSTKATCGATVALTVNDCDLNADPSGAESVTVEVSSLRQISGVRVALTETGPDTATFTGTLRLSAIPGSGGFLVAHGDQPLAVYKDADNGSGRSVSVASTLTVDCVPPQIAEVSASEVAARSAVVTFNTSEPAAARVRFGTACGEQTRDVVTTAYRAAHRITLTGLAPATIYYFSVEVIDEAGLAAAADAQGMCFSFITPVAANYLARQAVFDADLPDHRSVTLTPDGSTDFYAACVEPITELPVDPAGGVWMKNGGEVRLPSGRTVSLYGVPYGKFIIDNSGFLTFKGWDYDGFQSLANHFAMPRVSGLFGWYYPTEEGWVSYQQLDDRYAVTWEHVIDARTQRPSTFQVEMFFDGRIRMSWLEIGAYQPIIGLSAGRGMPADFDATDFTVLPACLVDPLVIEPRGPLSSRGLRGGPFEPACRGYRLTNGSDPPAEVAWSAQASQGWFTVSPAGGVLQPGQSVDVRVCVGQTAAQLSAREGVYSGEARFVRAGGAVQARDVELAVRSAVPPHASDVLVITTVDVPVRVTPAAEDDGRPDPPRALSCRLTSPPTHGEVVVGNGAEWTYVPRPGFVGVDRFRYRASDGGTPPDGGDSNEAEVIVRVVAPPAVPGPPSPPDGAVGVPIDAVEISAGSAGPSLMRSAIAAAAWPTGIDDPHFTDPRDKMMSTGRFHEIGIIDLGRGTPRVADLRAFDSVIVWSDDQFADPFALGDRLADYVDGGGGVVVAVFANTIVRTYVNLYGRFSKDNYFCIDYPTPAHACPLISYSPAALGTVLNPFHPAIQGVRSFNGGYQSFRPYSSYLAPGASLVASWSDGAPLVAAREVRGTPRVDLGMYPVSSDVDEWFWNASTDGAALLANSLAHTGGRSRVMTTYDVYFGTENPPTVLLASDLPEPRCPMSKILMYGNTYYWKMVARNRAGTTESPVFSFSTRPVAPVEVTDSLEDPRDLRLPFGVVPKGETRSAELTFCNIDPVNDFLLSGYSIGKAEEYLADYGDGAAPDWRPTEAGLWRVENGEYLAESSTGGEYLQSTYTGRSWRDARVRCRLRR
ncbi:MAG TPA: S8 family serine peptidase, partial [Phycisphaerae bacterium]|nr:S8 family serine peptidase [Phycisphaerae bacterium]